MANILYFTGAGASYNAIPAIRGNKDRKSFGEYFKETIAPISKFQQSSNGRLNHIQKNINTFLQTNKYRIENVQNSVNDYTTPDTYARSLYIKYGGDFPGYWEYKSVIAFFFSLWNFQTFTAPPPTFSFIDKRYLSLLSAVLERIGNGVLKLPENIKIVTWNYDNQIERTIHAYLAPEKDYSPLQIREMLKIASPRRIYSEDTSIVKLNGSYSLFMDSQNHEFDIDPNYSKVANNKIKKSELLATIANNNIFMNCVPDLSFAWEHDFKTSVHLTRAKKIFHNAEVMVIIGYSFPPYNRSVDKALIDQFLWSTAMKKSTNGRFKSKKIYIQSPGETVKEIEQRVKGLVGTKRLELIDIELIDQVEEFYIPFEL